MNVIQCNERKNEHRVKNFDIQLASFTDIAGWGKAYQSYAEIADTVAFVKFGVRDAVMYLIREAVNTRNKHAKTTTS